MKEIKKALRVDLTFFSQGPEDTEECTSDDCSYDPCSHDECSYDECTHEDCSYDPCSYDWECTCQGCIWDD